MRILHVYKSYFPDTFGGVEETIRQLSNGMNTYGFSSEVFTLSQNPYPQKIAFEDHYVFRAKTNFELLKTPFSVDAVKQFCNHVKNFDLIHYHYPYPFGDLLWLLSEIQKPSIVTYHSDIVSQRISKLLYLPLQEKFLKSVDQIVSTSLAYNNSSKVLQRYAHKTVTISLGLNSKFTTKLDEYDLKDWQQKLPDTFILYLGALRNYKGLDTLLKSAKKYSGNLVIAGDGSKFNRLKLQSQKNNLQNVYFTGSVSNAVKDMLLEKCSGLVLPSHLRSEAFGLVLLEAAMKKKPLISTELKTGTSFVNKDGITGVVVSPNNSEALTNALNFLYNNPGIASEMGKKAGERYNKLFTAELMCAEYYKIYKKVHEKYEF